MKCYACIRGCAYLKGALGLALVGVAIWIEGMHTAIIDCNAFQAACPDAFNGLIGTVNRLTKSDAKAGSSGETQAYCDCFSNCMNYMVVYERNQSTNTSDNCFEYSLRAGIPSSDFNFRRLGNSDSEVLVVERRLGDGGKVLPMLGNTCVSCEEIQGKEAGFVHALAGLAASAGIALILAAGSEMLEIKFHSSLCSLCVLMVDVVVAVELIGSVCIAAVFLVMALVGCDPDSLSKIVEDAGKDSTDGSGDRAAAFTDFFLKLLSPLMQNLCAQFSKFMVYLMVALLGLFASAWSAIATCCVCMGCTSDGKGTSHDDVKAEELRALMGQHPGSESD